jgi:ComF family protein
MSFAQTLTQSFAPLVDLIYPPRCPLCGGALAAQDGLCSACWQELVIPGEPACAKCQRPFNSNAERDGAVCAPCLAAPPKHDGIAAGTLYNDASRRLVLAYKHGNRIALSRLLSRLMNARLPVLEGDWLFVPVPLHRNRLWQRGFNQSALLSGELARKRGQALLVDGLLRTKSTPILGGLGRKARAKTLSGAIRFNPARRSILKGANIVLVDDVLTSGATSDACVSALKRAGAMQVRICCFARVLEEAL